VLLVKDEEDRSEPTLRDVKVSKPWKLTRTDSRSPGPGLLMVVLWLRFPTGSGAPIGGA
jgi:hypothetical protein